MKVLLDECVPRGLKAHLVAYGCHTVPEVGFAGKKNGELLRLAEQAGFDVFVTIDRGLEYQQNLQSRKLAIILMRGKRTVFPTCCPLSRSY